MAYKKGETGNPRGLKPGTKLNRGKARKLTQIAKDLQWAYKHGSDDEPGTPVQEEFRKLYKTDFRGFLAHYNRHVGAAVDQVGGEGRTDGDGAGTPAEADLGTERCVELCEKLLREWNEENPP